MKSTSIKMIALAMGLFLLQSCNKDDDNNPLPPQPEQLDFSGTFVQQDQMGRPGIATVFPTTAEEENMFNVTIPSEMGANFQSLFEAKLNGLHAAFGVEYENNLLGLDAATLTTVLASDVLQVAPDGPTIYYGGPDAILTGRGLTDDVIDISLILLFGGADGARFNGENGTPELVSDNVDASGENPQTNFPYVERPN
ncbi:DUF4331 family protein [Spongiivirga citrea]|uniref:DUF4331 domain-containing protein n=1 Tax=Spongiivirga citrea TaxID=1481457 RepID=A0A6M0CIC7_9FLAO|nr:DUF4331 family protein [Spongiivirga citrea]NER15689.1 DUF4331 domain-containing protein [Spongiivirga citrea]